MTRDQARITHWNDVARRWALYSSPLRPCAADLDIFTRYLEAYSSVPGTRPPRALILGVTPEIAEMRWPAGTHVTGIDRSAEMVAHIWPGDVPGLREARCADWFSLTPAGGRFDYIVGDGSLNTVAFPDALRQLLVTLARVASDGAVLVTRTFTRPLRAEQPMEVVAAAARGTISCFHAFKFRLAMALQTRVETGVRLDDVWQFWTGLQFDTAALADRPGWEPAVVETIELYRGKDVRLYFPTIVEVTEALAASGWTPRAQQVQDYEMGDRCALVAATSPPA
jgi:SAM-dependent methyltransferase